MRPLALLLSVLCLTGCEEPTGCDTMAAVSVSVTLLDESGSLISNAEMTYSVDGGDEVACDELGSGEYSCGYEVDGTLTIRTRAMGFTDDEFEVEVAADECHVIGVQETRTLESVGCTQEVIAGVLVNVTDSQLAEVTDATVEWEALDAGRQACTHEGGNQWSCAEDTAGEITLSIEDAGPYELFEQVVIVDHDGCHPITETLDAVLNYLAD
jgi:hypothetical protein